VLPVSAIVDITREFDDWIGKLLVGGPIKEESLNLFSPRRHGTAVGAAGFVLACCTNTSVSPRRCCTTLHPPNMFPIVASLRCPVACRLQVALVCSELRVTP
jgi:hypothetical protein